MSKEDDDEGAAADSRASAPMLSVRLKALDQIAKLYDVGLVQHTAGFGPLPYSTPEDIADDVRQRVLEMHGRGCGGDKESYVMISWRLTWGWILEKNERDF